MPISITSRYYKLLVYDATSAAGTSHPTVAIRSSTPPAPGTTVYRHTVSGVETMEYLAWRYYGDSKMWWRIAEANPPRFPLDLPTATPLNIPRANDLGTVVRDRRFA
jgi:hypothetical protein